MAKNNKKTEEVAASQDAAATPVEKVQETTTVEDTATVENVEESATVVDPTTVEANTKDNEEAEEQKPVKGYGFTADAPQSIRYNGEVYTQEEILTNEDLLAELVHGKCIFIKRN